MLRIDHVVYAVPDLDEAAVRFEADHGLHSIAGGVHPRWGTGNRVIPLGEDYVELIAVVDAAIAASTALGRAVGGAAAGRGRWFALCLADDDLDATAARLGLTAEPGSRTLPDGRVVAWRGAGIDDPRRTPDLPFFIAWDVPPGLHPGAGAASHPVGANGIAWVEIGGDAARFEAWTGGAALPVRVVDAEPGVRAVGLLTPGGEVVIR